MNIFFIEAPNPIDRVKSCTESEGICSLGTMFGHSVATFSVMSSSELTTTIEYLSTITKNQITENLVVHISCHGNDDGLGIGKDFLSWKEIGVVLVPLLKKQFKNKLLLCLSSCGTSNQKITNSFNNLPEKMRSKIAPPEFLFLFDQDTVDWDDALISWGLLYHQLGKLDNVTLSKSELIPIIDLINNTHISKLAYRRWDSSDFKYKKYPPNN